LNRGVAGKKIDVFLLDGRYFRDPKPCALRREFCEKIVLTSPKKDKFAWRGPLLEDLFYMTVLCMG
jgi:alkaline phosphatase D